MAGAFSSSGAESDGPLPILSRSGIISHLRADGRANERPAADAWLPIGGFLVIRQGFFVVAQVKVTHPPVRAQLGIILKPNRFVQVGESLVILFPHHVSPAAVVPRIGDCRVQTKSDCYVRDGRGRIIHIAAGRTEDKIGAGEVGIQMNGLIRLFHGFGELAALCQDTRRNSCASAPVGSIRTASSTALPQSVN